MAATERASARKRSASAPTGEVIAERARVLSVFGPFNSSALVMMPTDLANKIWPEGLAGPARSDPVEAVERDIEAIRQRDSDLADSALAAAALSMAYELINPFNSATSKSMCVARLMEAMAELRELVPPAETADRLDEVAKRRDQRRHRSAGT